MRFAEHRASLVQACEPDQGPCGDDARQEKPAVAAAGGLCFVERFLEPAGADQAVREQRAEEPQSEVCGL